MCQKTAVGQSLAVHTCSCYTLATIMYQADYTCDACEYSKLHQHSSCFTEAARRRSRSSGSGEVSNLFFPQFALCHMALLPQRRQGSCKSSAMNLTVTILACGLPWSCKLHDVIRTVSRPVPLPREMTCVCRDKECKYDIDASCGPSCLMQVCSLSHCTKVDNYEGYLAWRMAQVNIGRGFAHLPVLPSACMRGVEVSQHRCCLHVGHLPVVKAAACAIWPRPLLADQTLHALDL